MKRITIYIIYAILSILLFSQCTKGDEIGDLYGRWKLVRIECPSFSETPDSIFFGFQGQAYSFQANYKSYDWGMYEIVGNIFLFKPMQWNGNFKRIHLEERSPSFKIDLMDEEDIFLSRHDSVWVLKKFL